MISKVVEALVQDLINTFKTYSIDLTAQYTPDLSSFSRFMREYYIGNTLVDPTSVNKSKYTNRLLYRIGTPKPTDKLRNMLMSGYTKMEGQPSDNWVMSGWTDNPDGASVITKTNLTDSVARASGVERRVSHLGIPVEFMIVTEDLDLVMELAVLYHQVLSNLQGLEVSLAFDPTSPDALTPFEYFLNWNIDSFEVNYANFHDNDNALNTLSFSLDIQGPIFSSYYKERGLIKLVDVTLKSQ